MQASQSESSGNRSDQRARRQGIWSHSLVLPINIEPHSAEAKAAQINSLMNSYRIGNSFIG